MLPLDRTTLEHLASSAPPGRADQMRHAYEIFEKLDTPGGSEEAWKYVESDLSFDFDLVDTPGDPLPEGRFLRALTADAGRATLVDGHTVLASGPRLTAVSELDDSRQVEIHSLLPPDHDRFAAARTAFSTDGIEVEIPAGTVEEAPVVIDVQAVTPGASFPAISVRVGENAEGSVVVVYRSPAELDALTSPQVGLHVAQGGRLRYLAIQNFGFATTAVIHQRAQVGRDASLRVGEVGLGGRLGRLDLGVLLEGDGGSVEVVGLSFGEHDQILDYRMTITHRGRSTSSDVYLKGAVEDRARSIFTGLLKIEKQAARSSAFETNRNLVLSEHAKAHSVPNLEILCDDVVCGHGSSVGPLDEDQIYYLLSRGLSRARAERLLVKGFFSEVVDRLPVQGPAEQVLDEVFGRFVEAQAEGRLG